MTPRVSVIIPTYNRAKCIVEAVESVLNQSFQNYELIVVDDGSSDSTRQVLQTYLSAIKYIYQENAGVSAAINTGIRAARGGWIAILASDDIWVREYLAVQMEQVNRFPNAVAHVTNTAMVEVDGSKHSHFADIHFLNRFTSQSNTIILKKPFRTIIKHSNWWFVQSTIFYRNTLLQAGLFDESLSIAEDQEIMARVALKGEFTFRKEVLVYVLMREKNFVRLTNTIDNVTRYKFVEKAYAGLLRLRGLSFMERITVARGLSYFLRVVGNYLVIDGRIFEARKYYWKSFMSFPSVKSLIKLVATFLPKFISRLLVMKGRSMMPSQIWKSLLGNS